MCSRLERHREKWMRWNHFHHAGRKMTDRSRQVLDEWSAQMKSIVGSPCKRLLSAFPGLPLAIDWFLKWLKNFWVSYITNINVQPASAIIGLLNLELVFEISWWALCFYSIGFGVTNFPLKLDFENAEIFIFFLFLLGPILWFSLAIEPAVWKFSFVTNSYFLNGFGCYFWTKRVSISSSAPWSRYSRLREHMLPQEQLLWGQVAFTFSCSKWKLDRRNGHQISLTASPVVTHFTIRNPSPYPVCKVSHLHLVC